MNIEQGHVSSGCGTKSVAWAVAQAAKAPDSLNGDGYLISRDGDRLAFAVVDGVGSGCEAHFAADMCLKIVAENSFGGMLASFERCHSRLSGTRGAALALAVVDLESAKLEWAAVGDIDGCVLRPDTKGSAASMVQRGGTLGHQYTGAQVQEHSLLPGDVIVMCSDGVSRRYRDDATHHRQPADFVSACLENFGRKNDDRTVAAFSLQVAER